MAGRVTVWTVQPVPDKSAALCAYQLKLQTVSREVNESIRDLGDKTYVAINLRD